MTNVDDQVSVRARAKWGVWGPWSKTWSFTAQGPGRPRSPRIQSDEAREILFWEAPQEGRPVERYEIYASTDHALSPRRKPTTGILGESRYELPVTLIGESTSNTCDVTDRREVFHRILCFLCVHPVQIV